MKVAHLVLKHKWYDKIDSGEKKVEYRNDTDYWRKRLRFVDAVVFHRGYTKTTMTFEINWVSFREQIEIFLGKRISEVKK